MTHAERMEAILVGSDPLLETRALRQIEYYGSLAPICPDPERAGRYDHFLRGSVRTGRFCLTRRIYVDDQEG